MSNGLSNASRKNALLAAVCTAPVLPVLWATGHLGQSDALFHGSMLILAMSLSRVSLFRQRVSLAWLPAALAVVNIPVAVYIALANVTFQVVWFNVAVAFLTLMTAVLSFFLGAPPAGPSKRAPLTARQ